VYHLEGEGIIWSSRESSGGVCFIWPGRVSGSRRYRLKQESIFSRQVYHLEGEGIIWRGVYRLVG
jgi:hypothetical protein